MSFASWRRRNSSASLGPLSRPVQAPDVAADEDDAHAAALGDVDDLLLRGATKDGDAILRRGEAHDDVEGFAMHAAVGPDDGELTDGDAGEVLDDPAVGIGQCLI